MNAWHLLSAATGDIPDWFAVTMGIGTVFVGLISIILICVITGAICGGTKKKKRAGTPAPGKGTGKNADPQIVAAVCAACAEEMGADVNSLKVVSFKKLN